MKEYLSINPSDAGNISVKKLPTKIVFKNNVPFLMTRTNDQFELNWLGAAIWIEITSENTILQISNRLLSRYSHILNSTATLEHVLAALKHFYQNGVVELLEDGFGPIEVLVWKMRAIGQCHFALTYRCNMNCKHCLISRSDLAELSTLEVLDITEQLWKLGCESVNFSGGETLLRKDFPIIIEHLHNLGIEFGFNSNGTLFDEEILTVLDAYRPANIGISLYADNETIHDLVTQVKGSFSQTMRNIRSLLKLGLPVTIKSMVMKENYFYLKSIKELASSLGCQIHFDPHILPRQEGSKEPLKHRLEGSALESFYRSDFATPPGKNVSRWDFRDRFVCSAGLDRCAIDPYGRVYPCAIFPLELGAVGQNSLREILTIWSQNVGSHLPRVSDFKECRECEYRSRCNPCPGISFIEERDPKIKSKWICAATKSRLEHREN